MTTILFTNNKAAADSLESTEYSYPGVRKLYIDPDRGTIAGGAGESDVIHHILTPQSSEIEWYSYYSQSQKITVYRPLKLKNFIEPKDDEGGVSIVIVNSQGQSWRSDGRWFYPGTTPIGIGTGGAFAVAAMYASEDMDVSMRTAIEMDPYSGGPITRAVRTPNRGWDFL